ncbi:MAG: hypothetical protein J6V30_00525 [Paludibacteraceae bacterium]|nr:hypothetical protein [Paludibacteraceae bacterium]
MKKMICFFMFCASIFYATAQNAVTIHQKTGETISYVFSKKPVITYTEKELELKTTDAELKILLKDVAKFTFTDEQESVSAIQIVEKQSQLQLKENTVCISGAKPFQKVWLIGIDGRVFASYKTDFQGSVLFSISGFNEGVYIVKTESLTCKIFKR